MDVVNNIYAAPPIIVWDNFKSITNNPAYEEILKPLIKDGLKDTSMEAISTFLLKSGEKNKIDLLSVSKSLH